MVIDDLYAFRSRLRPSEANPVLLVDPDAALPFPPARQGFQTIARGNSQLLQPRDRVQLVQLAGGDAPKSPGTSPAGGLRVSSIEHILRAGIPERAYHRRMIARILCYYQE